MPQPLIVSSQPWFMAGFLLFVCIGLALDLGLFSKNKPHVLGFKEALWRTVGWITCGLAFSVVIYYFHHDLHGLNTNFDYAQYKEKYQAGFALLNNPDATAHNFAIEVITQYITGYFIEYSLSIDNLFVMMLIFRSFRVEEKYQKNVLLWGVIGAVIMRFIFIFVGSALLIRFHWLMYVFGGILLYSGFKLLVNKEDDSEEFDVASHGVVKWASRIFPVSHAEHHGRFTLREQGKWMVTSLFLVLLVVEVTDLIFAVDSVPAILGITRDPYLVFFSNIFAIMGLRSLYFLLIHGLSGLHTLKYGLSIILIFVGFKMIFEHWFKSIGFNHFHNLIVLVSIIAVTVLFGLVIPDKKKA